MIRFTGSIDGAEVLDRAFNRITEHISDFRNMWPGVAAVFYAAEEGQFASEGARGSGKWAALSLVYEKFKAVAFPGQPILKATNSLYESLTDPEAPDAIYRPEKDELWLGTKSEHALPHHRGAPKCNLPSRPLIALTNDDKRKMQKSIQSELVRFTRQAGFQVDEKAA